MRCTASMAFLFALLSPVLVAQSVVVVDAAGGGDVTTLQAGIDAAADGDILLVKPGDYTGWTAFSVLDGKALDIVADGAAPQLGSLTIQNLPAGSIVRLRGLDLSPTLFALLGATLLLKDNAGQVWVEDAVIVGAQGTGTPWPPSSPGQPAVQASACAGLTLLRCTLTGGEGTETFPIPPAITDPSDGGPALRCEDSDVAGWECVLTGGDGGSDPYFGNDGDNGGHGVEATTSTLFFSGCSFVGGRGGDGCATATPTHCAGGDGLHLIASTASVHLATSFAGGAGGLLLGGGSGLPGDAQQVPPGTVTLDLPGTARSLSCTAVSRELDIAQITYSGVTGDFIGLFLSLDSLFVPLYGKHGVYHLGTMLLGPTVLAQVTAPSGVLSIPFQAWSLAGLPIDGLSVGWQAFVKEPGGPILLSSPSSFTDIDASF